jgi:hypothetical protein
MSSPVPALSHVEAVVATHLSQLRPAQQRGLALWVVALLLARSGCERAILTALAPVGFAEHALRARRREWLYDGADRAAPCATALDVTSGFAPVLRWVLAWWGGPALAMAIDTTTVRERLVVLSISVLYQGAAIPVAWCVVPYEGPGTGAWTPHLAQLLATLAPAVPQTMRVVVLTDRGLWSPALWRQITAVGWHPVMRIRPDATFAPTSQRRRPARDLVPGPGYAGVGTGVADKERPQRVAATLLVVWAQGQAEPWLLLRDLAPPQIGVSWCGLRVWIEWGFRAIKSVGWEWQRTRRTEPARVARHWLVLAVATLLSVAVGTRLEEADWRGCMSRCCAAGGWGPHGGCCPRPGPRRLPASSSSCRFPLQELLMPDTSPSQHSAGRRAGDEG